MGVIYHFGEITNPPFWRFDAAGIFAIRLLAIVAGIFLLRGSDWARWLALAWIGFHVAISFYNSWQEVAMHSVILALFAYFLLRQSAARYFRGSRSQA
jgi:membrane protein implicated in regulation of membrane protease activity